MTRQTHRRSGWGFSSRRSFSEPARSFALLVSLLLGSSGAAWAANCAVTSVGFAPLTDLGSGTYQGQEGGLYPGGVNDAPGAHGTAGRAIAAALEPVNGKIVFISIGMSNTTMEFSRFVSQTMQLSNRNPQLLVVDCAQGGQDARTIANPNAAYWNTVRQRLATAGVDSSQVRVAWVKEAIAVINQPFPDDALQLKGYLRSIVMNLTNKFPNIRLAFLSSRIYAGYATGPLNPEPYAYQSGFAVKWLIADQMAGTDPGLVYDASQGSVESPWLGWGPYLWADGLTPRSDGLTWACSDLANDGTHPSSSGIDKVDGQLLDFFTTDPLATPWFLNDPVDASGVPAQHRPLLQVFPNPSFDGANIRLHRVSTSRVPVAIYDPAGRLVRVLRRDVDTGSLYWDGRDVAGRRMSPGIYFARAGTRAAAKIVLLQ